MKATNREHRHAAADRVWDCAYSFAHCRYWDARGFEPRPDWLVTDIEVIFSEPMREVLPGGGIPIKAAGFYARSFYSSASQALSLLHRHPAAFGDVARLTKSNRAAHAVTLVRNQIVEHPKMIDEIGTPIDWFGTSHSLAAGVVLARNDGPPDAGLVANAAALLETFEADPLAN